MRGCLADDISFLQCVRFNILRRRSGRKAFRLFWPPHILAASYWLAALAWRLEAAQPVVRSVMKKRNYGFALT